MEAGMEGGDAECESAALLHRRPGVNERDHGVRDGDLRRSAWGVARVGDGVGNTKPGHGR